MQHGTLHLVDRVGCMRPKIEQLDELAAGEIGFITAQIKEVSQTRVGDTITDAKKPDRRGAAGLQGSPAGGVLRPVPDRCRRLRETARIRSTSCGSTMPRSPSRRRASAALGFGFRCGFLGLLHLEIIQERLTREYDLDLITTAPSVVYKHPARATSSGEIELHNPADMPDPTRIATIEEPWIEATIYVPDEYLGSHPQAVPGPARHPEEPDLCRRPRADHLRAAAQRGGVRLLRPAEEHQPRLCQLRLSPDRPPRGRPRQDEHHGQRRAGRRAEHDRPPRHRRERAAAACASG